jgi:hypothetical protein
LFGFIAHGGNGHRAEEALDAVAAIVNDDVITAQRAE